MKFVDEVSITVSSGKGGPGCISFRREAKIPRGGPDGGDGGRGGSVIFKVNPQLNSLLDLRYRRHYQAGNGQPGGASLCSGRDGVDELIQVPRGTVIKSSATGHVIADMTDISEFVFLNGGRGGRGNAFFKTSVNQAPDVAQPGEEGQTETVHLELKLLADVGIIGLPNAGKSTLISRISAARPKVADYPFTTLIPHLGVVRFGEDGSFVVADIPGLVPGAHLGVGLGTQFLRHIERTRAFLHLIDTSEFAGQDPWSAYVAINEELKKYDEQHEQDENYIPLQNRPQLVVLNKMDSVSEEQLKEWRQAFASKGVEVETISAATGQNIKALIYKIGELAFGKRDQQD